MAAHLLLLLLAPALLLAGAPHATAATTVAGDLLGPAPGTTSGVGSAAEAARVGVDSMVASREANLLATRLALFCRHGDMPTASCCELVVAFVDHCSGAACLSHESTQPQLLLAGLDAARILALYAACGRARLGCKTAEAARIDSKAAETNGEQGEYPPPPTSVMPSQQSFLQPGSVGAINQVAGGCDSSKLATHLVMKCDQTQLPSRSCCHVVLMTVDGGPDCLCQVVGQAVFSSSTLTLTFMWNTYKDCHGDRQVIPKNSDTCKAAPAPPPASPPPPAPASPPPPPASSLSPQSATPKAHRVLSRAAVVGICCAAGVVLIGVIAAAVAVVRKLRRSAATTAPVADKPPLRAATAPTPTPSTTASVADHPRLPLQTAPPTTTLSATTSPRTTTLSATTSVADQLLHPKPSAPPITEVIKGQLSLID